MTMPQNVDVNVQGNFSGNLVIGDHNIVVNNPNGGVVNIVAPRPPAEPRTRPVNLRPRDFPGLVDRATEMDLLRQAFNSAMPVTLFGESGMGKTSLLRKAAHTAEAKLLPDGVVYLNVRETALDDVLQVIYDSFFTANPDAKPTEGELRLRLNKLRGLIFLDDVSFSRDDVSFLLNAMPQSLLLFSSEQRVLWGDGQVIHLDGLPEPDALQLFERELGRSVNADERPVAQNICRILLMHPLRILQTASMIREDGLSIPQAFQKLTTTHTQTPTVEMAVQRSSETQKKIFSLLAVAGGFGLTRDHLIKIIPAANFEGEVNSMLARGFITEQGSALSLRSDAATALEQMWNLTEWEDALTNHFTNWLRSAPQDMLIDQASDLLFHLIKQTGEKKQWPQLVELGKALERMSILQKKWQRWAQVLNLLRKAAQALADKKLEGWVLHQLGTRSMCLGAKLEAQEFLKQALNLRQSIGDKAGLQVTQHNLNVLMNLPVSGQNLQLVRSGGGGKFLRNLLIVATGGVAVVALVVAGLFSIRFFDPPAADTLTPSFTPSVTLTPIPPTHTFTPTRTATRTSMPTATLTPTAAPIVFYDFVARAGDPDFVYYEYVIRNVDNPDPFPLEFQYAQQDVEYPILYMKEFDLPFVGWLETPNVEDLSNENLVLAMYMFDGGSTTRGIFNVPFELRRGDEFVARVGHINTGELIPSDKDGVRFRLYYFVDSLGNAVLLDEIADFMDGKTREWRVPIPVELADVRVRIVLEVDAAANALFDYAAWLDAVLVGSPR